MQRNNSLAIDVVMFCDITNVNASETRTYCELRKSGDRKHGQKNAAQILLTESMPLKKAQQTLAANIICNKNYLGSCIRNSIANPAHNLMANSAKTA